MPTTTSSKITTANTTGRAIANHLLDETADSIEVAGDGEVTVEGGMEVSGKGKETRDGGREVTREIGEVVNHRVVGDVAMDAGTASGHKIVINSQKAN